MSKKKIDVSNEIRDFRIQLLEEKVKKLKDDIIVETILIAVLALLIFIEIMP